MMMSISDWGHPRLILESYQANREIASEKNNLPKRLAQFKAQYETFAKESWPIYNNEFMPMWSHVHSAPDEVILHFNAETPLVAQLSRPSIFDNASLPLDHTYGFIYLPSSQVKGCARAYAEAVWFPEQFESLADNIRPKDDVELEKAVKAWRMIEQAFGWAENSLEKKEKWLSPLIAQRVKQVRLQPTSVGEIIFGNGIPAPDAKAFPELQADVLNNHHLAYYNGADQDYECPPGDWESPLLVNYLAISPGSQFLIPIKSREGGDNDLLKQTIDWLVNGFSSLGFGSRTGVDYGRLALQTRCIDDALDVPPTEEPATASKKKARPQPTTHDGIQSKKVGRRIQLSFEIELTTPAFLAGVNQKAADCDLVAKSFKHGIRWWWRTMHAGFLSVDELREQEGHIFGSTTDGNRMSIRVRRAVPMHASDPKPFNFRPGSLNTLGIPRHVNDENEKKAQGLFYQAYGIHKQSRFYLDVGNQWQILIDLQPWAKEQVEMALRFFSAFGGVGSRSRKGFGSFKIRDAPPLSLPDLQGRVATVTENTKERKFDLSQFKTPSLSRLVDPPQQFIIDLKRPCHAGFFAIDILGQLNQAFAQSKHHDYRKAELGLPRKERTDKQHLLGRDYILFEGRPYYWRVLEAWKSELTRLKTTRELSDEEESRQWSLKQALDQLDEKAEEGEKLPLKRFSAPLFFRGEELPGDRFQFTVLLMEEPLIQNAYGMVRPIVSELAEHLRATPLWTSVDEQV